MSGSERAGELWALLGTPAGCANAEQLGRLRLAEHPDDPDAMMLVGLALGARGDVEDAVLWLDRAAAAQPARNLHPACDMMRLMTQLGHAELVALLFRACLLLAPDDARLLAAFAGFLRENGNAAAECG